MIHIRRYFAALAVLLVALGLYWMLVPRWLEPPAIAKNLQHAGPKPAPLQVSPDVRADLERLFQPPAWELEPTTKVIETEQATLLIRDYLPTPDGTLELNPCTLIFYSKSTSPAGDASAEARGSQPGAPPRAQRPIVLQAPAGAELRFDRPLDVGHGQFGKIVGGKLKGAITIFSPPSAPGADDALHLVTSEVTLTQDRIHAPHQLEFHYGQSWGRGSELEISLLPDESKLHTADKSVSFKGVQSLTLRRLDLLRIDTASLRKPGPAEPAATSLPAGKTLPKDEGPLEVTCDGRLELDIPQQLAVLKDNVEVRRLVPGGAPDRLNCDSLILEFGASASPVVDKIDNPLAAAEQQPVDRKPAAKRSQQPLGGKLQRIIAFGSPAVLQSPTTASRAVACRLEYSLARRRIVLVPGKQAPQVTLRREAQEFTARELQYELPEQGQIGLLWAAGPGQLSVVQNSAQGEQKLIARWDQELRVRPQDGDHVISLLENASVAIEPHGRFDADELHVWIREIPAPNPTERLPAVAATASPVPLGTGQKTAIQPVRLLATGKVRVRSTQLDADTGRLEAWFQTIPVVADIRNTIPANRPDRQPASAAPARPLGPRPFVPRTEGPVAASPQPAEPLQKFRVVSDLIQMQVVIQGKQASLEDLILRGHVTLDEIRTAEPNQVPIHIVGDAAELHHGTTPASTIVVTGNPAELGGRGMTAIGGKVEVYRGENRVAIDGPGEATLPVPADQSLAIGVPGMSAAPVREPETRAAAGPPQRLHVIWHKGLTFDGQTVHLEGEVEARTTTQVATCQSLDATLSQPVNLSQPRGGGEQLELGRLHMDGGVLIVNRGVDETGRQTSLDRMQVRSLTVDRGTGKLNAAGPGWVHSVRQSTVRLPGAPPAAASPEDPAVAPRDAPLSNFHIAFERAIVGELSRREIEFQRNVRVTYSPAREFDDWIVAQAPSDLGEQGILMTCEKLTLTEMQVGGQKWLEMQATENATVEGKDFTVRAASVRFTSDKEVLTVEGDGRSDAQVWYQSVPGEPRTYTSARKFRYWLRNGEFEGEDFNILDLQQLSPRLKIRGGRR